MIKTAPGNIDPLAVARGVLDHEAGAVKRVCDRLDVSFVKAFNLILGAEGRVIVTGVGKSGHVGKKIAATLASLGTPAFFVHSAEAVHGDMGMVTSKDIVIAISNSGETEEVLRIIPALKGMGATIIALTGRSESTLARMSHALLDIRFEGEADPLGLAPTSSSTATLALGDALAVALARAKGFERKDFAVFHPGGSLGKGLKSEVRGKRKGSVEKHDT